MIIYKKDSDDKWIPIETEILKKAKSEQWYPLTRQKPRKKIKGVWRDNY